MTVGRSLPLFLGLSASALEAKVLLSECCEPRKAGLPWAVPSLAMASVRALCLGVSHVWRGHPLSQGSLEVPRAQVSGGMGGMQ